MALLYTPNEELGTPCPQFSLPAVDNKTYSLQKFSSAEVIVVMFICNHCPYVMAIEDRYIALANSYSSEKVQFVGICANDSADYPEDSFANLQKRWREKNYNFPYLHDASQEVAKSFGAVCTPDIFVYNKQRQLAYRGRFDDSWKEAKAVKNQELKIAVDEILQAGEVTGTQHPSMGCSIKWRE